MEISKPTPKFRANPVEIAILAAVVLIFVRSVYTLIYDPSGSGSTLHAMDTTPLSEGRAPASASRAFTQIDFRCEANADVQTNASKIRILGKFCDDGIGKDGGNLAHMSVINQANHAVATVFTDVSNRSFSTDYISVSPGKNPIHVEFDYKDGRNIGHDLNVLRAN